MAERKTLIETPEQLEFDLAWGLHENAHLLPEAPRKGRIRLSLDDCLTIARRMVARLKARGVIEVRRQVAADHSYPPREPDRDLGA